MQFCDLVVISRRPGTGVSKNSKRMHSYPKKPSINVCKQIKTENSNGCQNDGMTAVRMMIDCIQIGHLFQPVWLKMVIIHPSNC